MAYIAKTKTLFPNSDSELEGSTGGLLIGSKNRHRGVWARRRINADAESAVRFSFDVFQGLFCRSRGATVPLTPARSTFSMVFAFRGICEECERKCETLLVRRFPRFFVPSTCRHRAVHRFGSPKTAQEASKPALEPSRPRFWAIFDWFLVQF